MNAYTWISLFTVGGVMTLFTVFVNQWIYAIEPLPKWLRVVLAAVFNFTVNLHLMRWAVTIII